MDIAQNLANVYQRIERACERVGRNPDEVKLVAVAKTKPPEMIAELVKANHFDIGENYLQEFLAKKEVLPDTVNWHFIGRIQSKKIKQIVGNTVLIHSVDRLKLFNEIEKRAANYNIDKVDCLLEINVGDEDSKGGTDIEEAGRIIEYVKQLEHVNLKGLMSIPPFLDNAELIRPYHKRLFTLREELQQKTSLELKELSMGMSLDFEAAIEEGATIVRVGTDIFGERNYKK